MITIHEEEELFCKFDSMSEIEIQSFMERFVEYLEKRDIRLLYTTPKQYKMHHFQRGMHKRNTKKAS